MGSEMGKARLDLRILGPLRVLADGRDVTPARPKQRALLALLVLHANEILASDELIDALWGEHPPATAQAALRGHVSSLRKLLGQEAIETRTPGYVLRVEPEQTDLGRFQRLLDQAGTDAGASERARSLRSALALFRGEPLADFRYEDFARAEAARLEELRVSALEERIDAELELGRHGDLIAELRQLVAENPLREGLWEQLMLALYRAGRQADALRAYRDASRVLTEQLGLGPGPALKELERKMLAHDPELMPVAAAPVTPAILSPREADQPTAFTREERGRAAVSRRERKVCPSCGRENSEEFRYCGACGADLTTASAHEVRKTVTVLFADVTGSTGLGERLDPESLRHVLARYFDAARICVERHGGTVEKFIGDAVMAVFGVPRMHEDDALRALCAAADLGGSMVTLNDQLERDYGVALQLRTGVNTGEVIAGTDERLATGDVVNVAARLEQAAQPGEILIGEQTRRLARAAIEVEPVDALSVKGKRESLHAHRLLRVIEGAPAFERRFDTPLVGRQEELARIRSAFDEAVVERRCRRVTVLGPPGIGKSRLAREVAANLANEAVVLSGRCLPYGEGITYWPLVEIFREAGAEDELEAVLSAGAPEEIFWSARKALERRAREQPMVLIVEDIHWAEPTLLDLLEHLADWTRDAPLMLLCLARPEFMDERPAWSGQSIMLEPLSGDDSEQLIAALLVDSDIESDTRARIREVAGGNPLFVEQLLAMVVEGGDSEQVPATMYTLLAARLDALPDDERDVLERASVVGLDFEWEAVGELSRGRQRPSGAELAALVRKEFIRPHEGIEDTFSFRHMLIRDAAYERIPKERRSELHERFASWLDGRDEELDEIVGYHLEEAYRCLADLAPQSERAHALAGRAASRLGTSGRRAVDRGDAGAALNLLERAAALPVPSDQRLSVLPSLGRVLREAGQMERADASLLEAIDHGQTVGDQVAVAHATVALSELRLHSGNLTQAEVLDEVERAMRVFREVDDEAGMARALTLRGKLTFWRGQAAEALEDLEPAVQLADEAGETEVEAGSLQYVSAAMHRGPMPVDEALARFEDLRPRAQSNRRLEVATLGARTHLEAMRMRFDTARDLVAEATALAEEHGLTGLLDSHIRPAAGYVELLAGDAVAAESELRAACEGTERTGELGFLSSIVPVLIDAVLMEDRVDEALSLTERWRPERLTVPEDSDAHVGWRRVRAKALARKGNLSEAGPLARSAVAIASATDYLDAHATAVADLGEVLRLAGLPGEAAAALEEAIGLHDAKGNVAAVTRLRRLLADPPLEV